MIISEDELKKNVHVTYNSASEILETRITIIVALPLPRNLVNTEYRQLTEDRLIAYLREKLRNAGGVD